MLIKHGAPNALEVTFLAPEAAKEVELRQPSEQDFELARLSRENEVLRSEIASIRASWVEELSAAERRAEEAAARDHVRDDRKRLEVLVGALADARQQFETKFVKAAECCATDLALQAMGKMFEIRTGDVDFLARIISRRLVDIDENAIVELQLSSSDADSAIETQIAAILPQGTHIAINPMLRLGTARVQLRLGTALIDPDAGFARLRTHLAGSVSDV